MQVTPGYPDQSTGEWVPEVETPTAIQGMIQTISLKELQKLEPGILSVGDRKLTVLKTAGLQVGDRVKIYEDSGGTEITEWAVCAKQDAPNAGFASLSLDFETFLLARKTG